MAQVLNTFTFDANNNRGTYDWNLWLNGSIWSLAEKQDFSIKLPSFLMLARNQAKKRSGSLKSQRIAGGVVIQFVRDTYAATPEVIVTESLPNGSSVSDKAKQLVQMIKEWATINYEKGGSFIIETMSDSEIAEQFNTLKAAKDYAKAMRAQELEVRNA